MTHDIRKKLRDRLQKRHDWLIARVAIREDGGAKAQLDREELAALRWALRETELLPQERAAKAINSTQEVESLRKRIVKQQNEIESRSRVINALRKALTEKGMAFKELNDLCNDARKVE